MRRLEELCERMAEQEEELARGLALAIITCPSCKMQHSGSGFLKDRHCPTCRSDLVFTHPELLGPDADVQRGLTHVHELVADRARMDVARETLRAQARQLKEVLTISEGHVERAEQEIVAVRAQIAQAEHQQRQERSLQHIESVQNEMNNRDRWRFYMRRQ